MKILLLYKSGRPGAGDWFARMMPVGLGWIHATLREAGFDSSLANLSRVDWRRVERFLKRERPACVGITLYTFNRHAGLRLARLARRANPGAVVVVGGPHASHRAAPILDHHPDVTAVALGEGERTMLEVAGAVRDGRPLEGIAGLMIRDRAGRPVATRPRQVVADLDTLPWPAAWLSGHHLDMEAESSFLITSRGCPARCTFCNTPDFWGTRMRFRSPENMHAEFRFLRDTLGLLHLSIRDDTFTVHKRRVIDFCRLLVDSGSDVVWNCQSRVNAIDEERLEWMRRAGCDHIQYGIESGSPRLLARLAKDITVDQIREAAAATRRVGMTLSIYLISGIPGETEEDFRATRDLLEECLPHDGLVAPLAVFPGTRIHDDLVAEGTLDPSWWERERRDTLYMMEGAAARRSFRRLTSLCDRVGRRAAWTRDDLEAHKARLPGAWLPRIESAATHARAGAIGEAIQEHEECLRLQPGNVHALIGIADLLGASGDRAGALLYLKEAAARAPRSRWVRREMQRYRRPARRAPARARRDRVVASP